MSLEEIENLLVLILLHWPFFALNLVLARWCVSQMHFRSHDLRLNLILVERREGKSCCRFVTFMSMARGTEAPQCYSKQRAPWGPMHLFCATTCFALGNKALSLCSSEVPLSIRDYLTCFSLEDRNPPLRGDSCYRGYKPSESTFLSENSRWEESVVLICPNTCLPRHFLLGDFCY